MAFGNKYPFMFNLCTAQVGTFKGTLNVDSEKDLVKIAWIPLGSLKEIISEEVYSKSALIRQLGENVKMPGLQKDYMIITEDTQGRAPFMDRINKVKLEMVAKYQSELRERELEASRQKYRADEKTQEITKQIGRDREMFRNKAPENPLSRFGLMGGGAYSNYRDFEDNNL